MNRRQDQVDDAVESQGHPIEVATRRWGSLLEQRAITTNVNMPGTDLRWTGDSFATSYKVYAGTDFPLDFMGEVSDEEFIGLTTSQELTELPQMEM